LQKQEIDLKFLNDKIKKYEDNENKIEIKPNLNFEDNYNKNQLNENEVVSYFLFLIFILILNLILLQFFLLFIYLFNERWEIFVIYYFIVTIKLK
jgi:hypothetical protein